MTGCVKLTGVFFFWLDNTKRQIREPKPTKCLYVGTFWSLPSTHIGKPLTVDVLLYMSSAVCRLLNYNFFFGFPNALIV